MTAQSPSAYATSVFVHAAVVALILFFAYNASQNVQKGPKILELVAGAGNNFGATEAPALGTAGGIKLRMSTPAPSPRPPTPPAPNADVVPVPPVKPVSTASSVTEVPPVAKAPASAKTPAPPDFVKTLERTEKRREARLEAQRKAREAAAERLAALQAKKAALAESKIEHIDAEGIAAGVVGGSAANHTGGAGGRALTRQDGDLLDAYYSFLRSKIKENFVLPEGVSDKLQAKVEFFLAADGTISKVRILRSSGNSDFDRAVLEAFAHTREGVGRTPDGSSGTDTTEFTVREQEPG